MGGGVACFLNLCSCEYKKYIALSKFRRVVRSDLQTSAKSLPQSHFSILLFTFLSSKVAKHGLNRNRSESTDTL